MIYFVEIRSSIDTIWVEADSKEEAKQFVERNILPQVEFNVYVDRALRSKEEFMSAGCKVYDATERYKET